MTECTRTEEQLVDYLEGTLPPQEQQAIDAHAAHCRACGAALRESRSILAAYRSVPDGDVGAAIAGKMMAAARLQVSAKRPRRRAWILVAAAAVVLVSAAVSVLWFQGAASLDPIAGMLREAEAHLASGEPQAAIASYEQALALARHDEREAEILHHLAELHVSQEDYAQALARLAPVIAAHPDYNRLEAVYLLRARALEGLGRREQALEVYRLVAQEFPASRDEALRKIIALGGLGPERETNKTLEALQGLGYAGD